MGGALEARHVDASEGKLVSQVTGEIEKEDGVLVIRRIHVVYTLQAPEEDREKAERVHGIHKEHCPVYRSIRDAIEVTTELEFRAG